VNCHVFQVVYNRHGQWSGSCSLKRGQICEW
jgi:hypothetical protein